MKLWQLLLVGLILVTSLEADAARRLGGGNSAGRQSANVTQREAAQAPAKPGGAQNTANSAASPAPGANPAAAAQPSRKPWGAMLGGLAAGLGLAWLAQSLGLGAAFGQFLLIALGVLAVMLVVGMVMRARRPQTRAPASPFAFQGAGGTTPADAVAAPNYNMDKVGNDASARPWERNSMAFETGKYAQGGAGVQIGSALMGSQTWDIPAGFDSDGFVATAKRNFVALQDAWDQADISVLRSMMTDGMLGEIKSQLAERESHLGGRPNKTEVVMLEARLLGIEDLGDDYMASVEFSGMIREEPTVGPSPFREVWNMTKPKSGSSGWLVAGVQALQ